MGISDRDVRSAAPTGARKPLTVSQSKSTTSESAGIVGTAHSRAANTSTLSAASIAAAAERKISSETLDKLGVVSDTVYFPDVEAKAHAFSFPYRDGHKYRSVEGKHFVSQKGFKISFWGEDEAINSRKDFVCIVEGEMDRCALVEAGLSPDTVLSVPNGSARDDKGPSENPFEVAGYQYVLEALKRGLHKKKRFIWCGDADEAGMSLRADMAHLFGAARFYFVDWPEGCNDANAVLKSDGPDYLRERVLDGNLPWPTNGLYRLHEIPETAPLQTWTTGMPGWDRYIKLAPGTLSVATGYPNHGKTRLWAQIWTQIARRYKIVVAVATFETRAKPHYRKMIRESYHHLAEWKQTEEQKLEADAFINAHFLFLIHPDRRPDLKWFLDQAEIAVVRHGASVTQIDPWNRLEAARNRNETETDFIGRCLRESHGFSQDLNCHLQVVAHPRMPDGKAKYLPPDLFSVSGCYSDDTEVLTKRGWLHHAQITLSDMVACFDMHAHSLRWDHPSKIWEYDYSGPMHHHRYRGGDLMVTPNHKMVVRPGWKAPKENRPHRGGPTAKYIHTQWEPIRSDMLFGGIWRVPQSANFEKGSDESDSVSSSLDNGYESKSFWSYIGWWIAEGCTISNGLDVCQRDSNAFALKAIIQNLNLDGNETYSIPKPHQRGTAKMWRFRIKARSHPQLTRWVIENCGIGCENKKIPESVWALPLELKTEVFNGLMAGDGSRRRRGFSYSTTSITLRDQVQRLAIELGYTASVLTLSQPSNPKHKTRYSVAINSRIYSALHPERNSSVENYTGKVWCLTVPTGAYIVRRNGSASICGNSAHWNNMVDQGFCVHRPKMYDKFGERLTTANFYHLKAKFEELGFPCRLPMDYDLAQARYKCGPELDARLPPPKDEDEPEDD